MSNVATYLRKLDDFRGDARLYILSEPISFGYEEADYVVVSAVTTYFGPETYIFPADANGKVLDWMELHGSFRGGLDHEAALIRAGYEVIR